MRPGHAEHAEVGGRRGDRRVDDAAPEVASSDGLLAPAETVEHVVADGDTLGARLLDDADRAAVHRLAERVRRGVRLGVAHPAAHVGVDRHDLVAHPDLAVGELGHLALDELEVLVRGPADGSGDESDLAGSGGRGAGVGHDDLPVGGTGMDSVKVGTQEFGRDAGIAAQPPNFCVPWITGTHPGP